MINYLSFDIEDWFQVENLRSHIQRTSWDNYELRVVNNTQKILACLQKNDVKATFFVLGWIAEKCPELVRIIHVSGHEVASHGYSHELVYRQSPEVFRQDILLSKRILEDITKTEVVGYRAPNFSITNDSLWAVDILKECGLKYDSSIFPTSFHDRYGCKGVSCAEFDFPNGLHEITVSTFRFCSLNLPVGGGGYFRLFPYAYFKNAFNMMNKKGVSAVFYLHPWEFDPQQPRIDVSAQFKFRHYVNLHKTFPRLQRLLADFKFQPLNRSLP